MNFFYGYPGTVWECCYNSLLWLQQQTTGTTPVQTAAAIEVVYATLKNGIQAVEIWQNQTSLQNELILLQQVAAQPLSLTANELLLFNNRLTAVENMIVMFTNALPVVNPIRVIPNLPKGIPGVPAVDLVLTLSTLTPEAPPAGVTAATLIAKAQTEADMWADVVAQMKVVQGFFKTQAIDAADRQAQLSEQVVLVLTDLLNVGFDAGQTPNASDPETLWNQMVALPALLSLGTLLFTAPYAYINQMAGAIRFALANFSDALATNLLALRKPVFTVINVASVQTGDSLMDIAARNLGNFEDWPVLASLNGLVPPFTGPQQLGVTTIAGYGTTLLLPQNGSANYPAGYPLPSYTVNVLGIDIYYGPLNKDMLPWNGDFLTISGYDNLSLSLGRRLQTTIGDLIYHVNFGSRIPPEVGAVQTQYEAQRIAIFGQSALLADPRVAKVLNIDVRTPNGSNSAVEFTGTVQPIGFGAQSTTVIETLAPLPSGAGATVG